LAKRFSSLSSAIAAAIQVSSFWYVLPGLRRPQGVEVGFRRAVGKQEVFRQANAVRSHSVPRNTGYKFSGIHSGAKFSPPIAAEMCRKNDNANFGARQDAM
jgi:hypothetical protein